MLIGPVFTREATIAPRRIKTYVARSAYGLALVVLMCTAWLVLTGTQLVSDVGDLARFGMVLFQILAPLQLALAIFFAALLAASEVAHEKDRKTLILLLLTNLSNSELVLGKLLASLLNVLVMLATALPVFLFTALLGGVSYGQIARAFAVTLAAVLACGSLGSMLALWREKTFQALAMTALVLVLWLALGEVVASGAVGASFGGLSCRALAAGLSPWEAILEATRPYVQAQPALGPLGTPVHLFVVIAAAITVLLNGVAMAMVRVWNPSREIAIVPEGENAEETGEAEGRAEGAQTAVNSGQSARLVPRASRPSHTRRVWDNPVIWREIRTWAYGRKILVVRLAYLAMFALAVASLYGMAAGPDAAAPPSLT